jgi:hypothetical protein
VYQGHLTDTSDQYSLAITYAVLRTGHFPFPPLPAPADGQPAKPPIQQPPDLSGAGPGEQAALTRALATVPQARFPTCRDLMRALIKANGLKVVWSDEGTWRIATDEETLPEAPVSRPGRSGKPPRR